MATENAANIVQPVQDPVIVINREGRESQHRARGNQQEPLGSLAEGHGQEDERVELDQAREECDGVGAEPRHRPPPIEQRRQRREREQEQVDVGALDREGDHRRRARRRHQDQLSPRGGPHDEEQGGEERQDEEHAQCGRVGRGHEVGDEVVQKRRIGDGPKQHIAEIDRKNVDALAQARGRRKDSVCVQEREPERLEGEPLQQAHVERLEPERSQQEEAAVSRRDDQQQRDPITHQCATLRTYRRSRPRKRSPAGIVGELGVPINRRVRLLRAGGERRASGAMVAQASFSAAVMIA
jgi:hypothetical protein